MLEICICIWSMALLAMGLYVLYKKKNIFHPIAFFLLFQFLQYGLPLMLNKPKYYANYNATTIGTILAFESIFIISVMCGYFSKQEKVKFSFGAGKIIGGNPKKYDMNMSKSSYVVIWGMYIIGMASRIYMFAQMGGIRYILSNAHAAYSGLISGQGLVSVLSRLMLVSIVCMFEKVLVYERKADKIAVLLMSILYMGSYLVYSSRGPALELILVLLCCYSINKKAISLRRIFKPKFLLLLMLMFLLVFFATTLRTGQSYEGFSVFDYITAFISEFNRADRDIFTYGYFGENEKWYGKIFVSVLTMFIPSSLFPNKPPVDDGFYLMNLISGNAISGGTGRLDIDMTRGSVPFTSQGLAYANFGVFGIVLVGIITGILYKKAYASTMQKNNTLSTLIYFYVIYMFGFTPLLIQNTLSVIIFAYIMKKIVHIKI